MILSKEKLSRARVLVVGDVMLDRYWHGAVERISPEAPVPIVRITREEDRGGGAANAAYSVAALGARSSLLSIIGNDWDGHKLETMLSEMNVQTHFQFDPTINTTVKLRVIGRQQQLLRLDFENIPKTEALLSQNLAFATLLPQHDVVLFSDYGKGSLVHIRELIALARAVSRHTLVDPKGSDFSRYKRATLITPNRSELQQVIGTWLDEADLLAKVQNLRQHLEITALLLTRSDEGMTLFDEQGSLHVSAQARDVFDVTGAGDTVIATMATLMAAGMSIRDAVPLANKAGGLVVGKFGTSVISYEELFT